MLPYYIHCAFVARCFVTRSGNRTVTKFVGFRTIVGVGAFCPAGGCEPGDYTGPQLGFRLSLGGKTDALGGKTRF